MQPFIVISINALIILSPPFPKESAVEQGAETDKGRPSPRSHARVEKSRLEHAMCLGMRCYSGGKTLAMEDIMCKLGRCLLSF